MQAACHALVLTHDRVRCFIAGGEQSPCSLQLGDPTKWGVVAAASESRERVRNRTEGWHHGLRFTALDTSRRYWRGGVVLPYSLQRHDECQLRRRPESESNAS